MRVLHICNDFLGTSAHVSLFSELDNIGIEQIIYVPLHRNYDISRRSISFVTKGSKLIFSTRMNPIHKYLYGLKINTLVKDLISKIDVSSIDIIHASIMCNEGAIAYELSKKYKIPYITAVRNTDINSYFRFLKWRKAYFKHIAENASRIIFISSHYPYHFSKALGLHSDDDLIKKFTVIHNGLDSIYIDNRYKELNEPKTPVSIVITGAFVHNKNIHGVIEAVNKLVDEGYDIKLTAIGNNLASYLVDKQYAEYILEQEKKLNWFSTMSAIPKEDLLYELRKYDLFVLTSFKETFGLSYLEALSQGLPIVYTLNEGFDGTYPNGFVGYGADANNADSIADSIKKCINNYRILKENVVNIDLSEYRWSNIAKRYKDLYYEILKNTRSSKL